MKELFDKYVGKKATIWHAGLTIEVTIDDVKTSYGKDRFHVTPIAGSGAVWVESVTLV